MNSNQPVVDQNWYLAQVKPNGLNMAMRNLERQKFSVFLPLHQITKRRGTEFITSLQPLFPGYLFVAIEKDSVGFRLVNNTRGISKLVSFGSGPAVVPDQLVLALKSRNDELAILQPGQEFSKGDKVKVTRGPFSEFIATVDCAHQDERIWLLLEFLGRTSRISVDRQSIRATK